MRQYTSTVSETLAYYNEEVANYKTVSSKKAFLTRSRKAVEEYRDDLARAYGMSVRMLHGERVNRIDILMAVTEIKIINNIYNTL
tara:strand:+ start:1158 stop:1412 length:255 start_codon:yes stop_codon:yes gene_type:complete